MAEGREEAEERGEEGTDWLLVELCGHQTNSSESLSPLFLYKDRLANNAPMGVWIHPKVTAFLTPSLAQLLIHFLYQKPTMTTKIS